MNPALLPRWLFPIVRWFLKRAFKKNEGATCESCGQKLRAPDRIPDALWDSVVVCDHCGHRASILSVLGGDQTEEERVAVIETSAEPPANSRVRRNVENGELVWEIPAKGGCGCLGLFACVWTAFPVLALVLSASQGRLTIGIFAFLCVFILVGLGVGFAALRGTQTRHTLWLGDHELTHDRHFLGRTRRVAFPRESVRSVELVVFFEQNYKPIYGIEIRSDQGKIRFGSQLSPDEKRWLRQDLRRALGMEKPESQPLPELDAGLSRQFVDMGDITLSEDAGGCVVEFPSSKAGIAMLIVGGFMAAVAGFMFYKGLSMMMGTGERAPLPFWLLWNGFSIFWCAGVAFGSFIGMSLMFAGWRMRRERVRLTATTSGFRVMTTAGSRLIEEEGAAATVSEVRVVRCATSRNDASRKGYWRVELLLPERVHGLGMGHPRARLEAVASALRRVLLRGRG